MRKELCQAKHNVNYLFDKYESTRDNDWELLLRFLHEILGVPVFVDYKHLENLPVAVETITRCRRKIQNDPYLADNKMGNAFGVRMERQEEFRKNIKLV